jgi:hypothetical protein
MVTLKHGPPGESGDLEGVSVGQQESYPSMLFDV